MTPLAGSFRCGYSCQVAARNMFGLLVRHVGWGWALGTVAGLAAAAAVVGFLRGGD